MSLLKEHKFQFTGKAIADACDTAQEYHEGRLAHWQKVVEQQIERGKGLKSIVKKREQNYTGGKHVEFYADIVDLQDINERLRFAAHKIDAHRASAQRYKLMGSAYRTNEWREYELDPEDVAFFKLDGSERED